MIKFDNFPEESTCLLCGTNENGECTLIPIDGTTEGNIGQATPVHVECIRKIELRYQKGVGIFYTMQFDKQ